MPVKGVECKETSNTFQECLKCNNPCAPYPLRAGIFANIQDRGRRLSPSLLTRPCLLSTFLAATNDYYLSLERLYQPNYGTAIHEFLERHSNSELTELKVESVILDISGTLDNYNTETRMLTDYKSTANIGTKTQPSEEHIWQVNLYAYMLREKARVEKNEFFHAAKAQILYLDPKRWLLLSVPLFSDEEVAVWAHPKIQLLKLAFKGKVQLKPKPSWMCNGYNKDKKIYCEVYHLCKGGEK